MLNCDNDSSMCYDHNYEFQEMLPSNSEESFQELWVCIHCGHERVITHQIGVRD
jgi:N-acetylmuramoyl-L-alanine amidase CwlA